MIRKPAPLIHPNSTNGKRLLMNVSCATIFAGEVKNRAFTLVELLVVVAIIGILAALLLPALNRAKIAADAAGCRSNLHQQMLAICMYVHDYSAYPGYDPTNGRNYGTSAFLGQIQPYTRAPWPDDNYLGTAWLGSRNSIYACPAYNRFRGMFLLDQRVVSYGYNSGGYGYSAGYWLGLGGSGAISGLPTGPTRENQVVSPSDMIAMGDATLRASSYASVGGLPELDAPLTLLQNYRAAMQGLPPSDPAVQAMRQRHNGRWLIVFCDGHVESLRAQDLFTVTNAAVAQRWNSDHQPH